MNVIEVNHFGQITEKRKRIKYAQNNLSLVISISAHFHPQVTPVIEKRNVPRNVSMEIDGVVGMQAVSVLRKVSKEPENTGIGPYKNKPDWLENNIQPKEGDRTNDKILARSISFP